MTWRTETVLALCRAVREEDGVAAAAVLADALDEAGCPPGEVDTARLRAPDLSRWEAERLAALAAGGAAAAAVRYMDDKAEEMGPAGYPVYDDGRTMTYELLITAARAYAATGDDGMGGGCMNWSNSLASPEEMAEFWGHFTVITGRPRPDDDSSWGFMSCSC